MYVTEIKTGHRYTGSNGWPNTNASSSSSSSPYNFTINSKLSLGERQHHLKQVQVGRMMMMMAVGDEWV